MLYFIFRNVQYSQLNDETYNILIGFSWNRGEDNHIFQIDISSHQNLLWYFLPLQKPKLMLFGIAWQKQIAIYIVKCMEGRDDVH